MSSEHLVCHALGGIGHRCDGAPVPYTWTMLTGGETDMNLCPRGKAETEALYKTHGQVLQLAPRAPRGA